MNVSEQQCDIPEHRNPEHETFQSRARARRDERVNESFTTSISTITYIFKDLPTWLSGCWHEIGNKLV